MTQQSYKQRTYLDPVYGPIQLNLSDPTDSLLAQIIDTREFQRLRRIRQMGSAWLTFHGAEHSRFSHSIGALFVAKKILTHLANNSPEINNHKTEILVSALIHDIGHGPFSHTSEKLTGFSHEFWTKRIIEENSEINSLLKKHNTDLPKKIISLFEYKAKPAYLSQIISSYVDCDRLDYLQRDSFFVGVPYGLTGSDRIISSLEIDEASKRLVIKESSGLDAIIHYLHARYSMYQQVYQHKKNLACDFMLRKIISRLKENNPKNISSELKDWLNIDNKSQEKISLESYLRIDDYYLTTNIQEWAHENSTESVLKDLCYSFITRKIFKSLEFRNEIEKNRIDDFLKLARSLAKNKNLDPNYYIGLEESASKPYEPYEVSSDKTSKAILIKQYNGSLKELSEVSGLVKALSQEKIVKTCLIFKTELEDDIKNINGFQELFK